MQRLVSSGGAAKTEEEYVTILFETDEDMDKTFSELVHNSFQICWS